MADEKPSGPSKEGTAASEELTTTDRVRFAEAAELAGQTVAALRAVAEVLVSDAGDLDARRLGARLVAKLGFPEGAQNLVSVARSFTRLGFPLASLGTLKDALDLNPESFESVAPALRELHRKVAGQVASRVRVHKPGVPRRIESSNANIPDDDVVLGVVEALAKDLSFEDAPAGPLPPFSEVSEDAFVALVRTMKHVRFAPGQPLVTEGDSGASLFVLVHGMVEVSRQTKNEADVDRKVVLATLGPGTIFGEMSLMTSQRRGATVMAIEPAEAFEVDRQNVELVAAEHPVFRDELVRFARRRMIGNLLATSPLFRKLGEVEKREVLRLFGSRVVGPGELIIAEGSEPVGLFLIASGEVEISKADPAGDRIVVAALREGEVFGEMSLLGVTKTTATAVAAQRTVLLSLGIEDFAKVRDAHAELRAYLETLKRDRADELSRLMDPEAEVIDADDLILV